MQGKKKVSVHLCGPSLTDFVALCEQMLDLSQCHEVFTGCGAVGRRQLFIEQALQDQGPDTQRLQVGYLLIHN